MNNRGHRFGGTWTEQKLECVSKYLHSYTDYERQRLSFNTSYIRGASMATQLSKIEWTESTWNPVRGCTRVSEGCRFCYAERIAARFSGKGMAYEGLAENTTAGPRWTKAVRPVPEVA